MISTADMAISIHEVAKTSTMDISMKIHNICISIHEVAKTSTCDLTARELYSQISIHEVAKTSTTFLFGLNLDLKISIHEVAKTSTANPSKNQIPSPAKSISIIQPPHDYFHQIIISTLYFIHFSPKTGANSPANPWELTVRTN